MRTDLVRLALLAGVVITLAGCGGNDDSDDQPPAQGESQEPARAEDGGSESPVKRADTYAYELAGTRTGCLEAKKGEGAGEPGCVYAAAYAGCYEGITGEQLGPVSYQQEFPEPELRETYERAAGECGQ